MMLKPPALLSVEHEVEGFRSGVTSLDDWLIRRARGNQSSGASRTYVVADDANRVIAYYALAAGAIASTDATSRFRRNMPDPIPVAILGRLAIDQAYQGQGLGTALLKDCVFRVRQAASILGVRGLVVHALSDEAKRFYEKYGFIAGRSNPMTLVLSLTEV
jgi:GNAT superfamily N-acetyltransferase